MEERKERNIETENKTRRHHNAISHFKNRHGNH